MKRNFKELFASFSDHWSPKVVAELNGQQVKLAKFQGPFEWHHHADEDEMFIVHKGSFTMQFRDRDVEMHEGDFIVIPKGVEHKPIATEEVEVILIEPASTLNTGNIKSERTIHQPDHI